MIRIKPLKWPEHVRLRPGMYIGGTDARALHVCVFELVANSMEEHLEGRGASISVTIHEDGSLSVKDDGGGISVAMHPKYKIPFVEFALTTLNVPDDYLKRPYRVLGLCGVGTKAVNAVSEWMQINTVWEGDEYQIEFARGQIKGPLKKVSGSGAMRGTTIRFKPDHEIFRETSFDRNRLTTALDRLAVIHPGLEFWLIDERPNSANRPLVSSYHYPKGIADYLKLIGPQEPRHSYRHCEPLLFQSEANALKIAVGFQFTESVNTSLLSFANSTPTCRNGTHATGFLQGLADALTELGGLKEPLQTSDMRPGLNAVVAVWLRDPFYGGSTKDELINPELKSAVRELTYNGVKRWAADSSAAAQSLLESFSKKRLS